MSELDDNLLAAMFLALQINTGGEFPDGLYDENEEYLTQIPSDIYETFLSLYFNLTSQEIREKSAIRYNAESDSYETLEGIGGGPAAFIITEFQREGNILTFSYDWYQPADIQEGEEFYYELGWQGTMEIEENDDTFVFVSNMSHNYEG